ncbi:defensin-like peptide family protein [Acinetobacter baumannii 984213]|nr:defensin-like peptide family protein [Acinetobacter baumannii 984213]
MNEAEQMFARIGKFLNGVCRHEHNFSIEGARIFFLNGVCRHEQPCQSFNKLHDFLNGVCRHERPTDQACKSV